MIERSTYGLHLEDILDEVDVRLGGTRVYGSPLVGCYANGSYGVESGDGSAYALNTEGILDLLQRGLINLRIDDCSEIIDEDIVSFSIEVVLKKGHRECLTDNREFSILGKPRYDGAIGIDGHQ